MRSNYLIKSLILIAIPLLFSCGNSNEQKNPDSLGWTDKEVENLKKQCLWQYTGRTEAGEPINKEIYCDCFVKKISISIPREDHQKPSEDIIKQYEQFRKVCEALSRNDPPQPAS